MSGSGSGGPVAQSNTTFDAYDLPSSTTHLYEASDDNEKDQEAMAVSPLSKEDAQSLIELSMSRVATHLKSARTPAIEKAAAMEEVEAGGYFDSDFETPPALERFPENPSNPKEHETVANSGSYGKEVSELYKPMNGLSLGKLPSPNFEEPPLPTPWLTGPKPFASEHKDTTHPSSIAAVFSGNGSRTRSLSGGAEALRKLLPKGLPSIAQVGNMFGSSSNRKARSGGSLSFPREPSRSNLARSASPSVSGGSPSWTPRSQTSEPSSAPRSHEASFGQERPAPLRRSTSDNSLLYHSLSRASSLGDDSRFENHSQQVNSRVKAIRDSLQDRSSFRMPQMPQMPSLPNMPSMPSMPRVSSFGFNMNFINTASTPARWRTETNYIPDILTGTIAKKKSSTEPPAVAPGMIGAAVSRPEAAFETVRTPTDGPNSTFLDRAMEDLTGDVVIMGGYRGSILRSTKNNRQVWVPVKVGLNIRKVDLEVGLEPEDEERMPETIYPSGMLQNIGPVDISKRLLKRLAESENARCGKLRVWDYGYDWRLSPHLLSRQLQKFLETLPSNNLNASGYPGVERGALVIAHSLGGLITRHVVNRRPDLFSGVIYAGVPQACVNILGPLRNGDAVLLSSRVLTAQVNFTLRTSFVLLPEDKGCFVDIKTKEKYPVDFFSVDDWIKYRLSPCTDPPLPPKNPPPSALGGLLNMPGSLLSLPMSNKKSTSGSSPPMYQNTMTEAGGTEDSRRSPSPPSKTTRAADVLRGLEGGTDRTLAPQMAGMSKKANPVSKGQSTNTSVSTAVTIPREKAIAYLERTLRETKKFKQELHFNPQHSAANAYPPLALIYGKAIPTCCGAKVDGLDSIPCADVYDNLAFASGDGVCLAKEAMLPKGYQVAYGGRISSDRGHVTLLGDLNAVGRAIEAVLKGRTKGIGKGTGTGVVMDSIVT
ncbi:related to Bacillus licheniformis esterase [Rhynchosporium secalis]|uniref:Related to Bacillus licheniformis esterase n=1 Tax=Rhynchosporium secalis TaxID=38038 RepID=A0A1E1MN39_RHYSE|nr:related to Bacillus licheniformis esterase [Rhynchosporium secalis]